MFVRQFMERIGADTLHFLHYYDRMVQLQAFPLALPLGELSPKVTERALQALLNGNINLCTHAAKIPVDVSVGKSQNLQSKRCQKCGTLRIIGHPLRLIVLRTIQFNNQLGRSTIKVCDKSPDDSLFINLHRIFAEEKIPELSFVGRHLSAQPPGVFQLAVVLWYGHILPSQSAAPTALPKGEPGLTKNAEIPRPGPLRAADPTKCLPMMAAPSCLFGWRLF